MQMTSITTSIRALAVVACVGSFSSCGIIKTVAEAPGKMVAAVGPKDDKSAAQKETHFSDLARYGDLIVERVDTATREFEAGSSDVSLQLQAARWRLEAQNWTIRAVADSNPTSSLLDMIVQGTVATWLHADHWIPDVYGEVDRPMLTALQSSVDDGWNQLAQHLDAKQIASVHAVLDGWRAEHPKVTSAEVLDVPNFRSLAERGKKDDQDVGNLLGIIGLDPLSGLEPVTRQVELLRRLGERAAFFLERAPQVLGAEVDVRLLEARSTPEMRQVLLNVDTFSASVKRFADVAEKLPAALSTERQAALDQVSRELTAQREGLVHDLGTAEAPLSKLLDRTQTLLDATTHASTALTDTFHAFDALMARFEPRSAAGGTPPSSGNAGSSTSRPFDITEYTTAIERLGSTAERLDVTTKDATALIAELDQRLPEVQRVVDATAQRGESVVDHALVGALVVGLILIAAAAGAAIFVRRARAKTPAPAR